MKTPPTVQGDITETIMARLTQADDSAFPDLRQKDKTAYNRAFLVILETLDQKLDPLLQSMAGRAIQERKVEEQLEWNEKQQKELARLRALEQERAGRGVLRSILQLVFLRKRGGE